MNLDSSTTSLTLHAPPGTDFWRKPPALDASTAPTSLLTLPSARFRSVRARVSARWARQYDQGGLFLFFPSSAGAKRCWLKAGVEFVQGSPRVSVVAAPEWADWSLHGSGADGGHVTLEAVREDVDAAKGTGSSLFVYVVTDGKRAETPIREVTWAFAEEGEVQVGVYAARPTTEGEGDQEALEVTLEDIRVVADS